MSDGLLPPVPPRYPSSVQLRALRREPARESKSAETSMSKPEQGCRGACACPHPLDLSYTLQPTRPKVLIPTTVYGDACHHAQGTQVPQTASRLQFSLFEKCFRKWTSCSCSSFSSCSVLLVVLLFSITRVCLQGKATHRFWGLLSKPGCSFICC